MNGSCKALSHKVRMRGGARLNDKINQLTNRHLAKLLDKLDEINTPEITKDSIKSHFRWFSDDIKKLISEVQD